MKNKEPITEFLDTKVKNHEEDPDKKWFRIRICRVWLALGLKVDYHRTDALILMTR
jgi:hypothetical protein